MRCKKVDLKDKNLFNWWYLTLPLVYNPYRKDAEKCFPKSVVWIYLINVLILCIGFSMRSVVVLLSCFFCLIILIVEMFYLSYFIYRRLFFKHFSIRMVRGR